MTSEVKLEPCPLCNDPMEHIRGLIRHVHQGDCLLGQLAYDETSIERWNRRASPDAEPVAWRWQFGGSPWSYGSEKPSFKRRVGSEGMDPDKVEPLYASPPAPAVAVPDFVSIIKAVEEGFLTWATKPHNKKWAQRIAGTPIQNDLGVCISMALIEAWKQPPLAAAPQPPATRSEEPVTLVYTNWRGETAERSIIPQQVWFGSTPWHTTPQWLLRAFDVEKGEHRDFALKDFGTPPATRSYAEGIEAAANIADDSAQEMERLTASQVFASPARHFCSGRAKEARHLSAAIRSLAQEPRE